MRTDIEVGDICKSIFGNLAICVGNFSEEISLYFVINPSFCELRYFDNFHLENISQELVENFEAHNTIEKFMEAYKYYENHKNLQTIQGAINKFRERYLGE